MRTTAEQFRRLLPTLQHVARFPGCNVAAICKRDGVNPAEFDAVIVEACGSLSIFDEEYLAKMGRELGVSVGEYKPARPRLAPAAESPRIAVSTAAKPPTVQPRPAPAKQVKEKFLAVCRALLADPKLSENKAATAVGVGSGSWFYFRKSRLGDGPLDRDTLRRFVELVDSGAAPDKPTEKRLPANRPATARLRRAAKRPAAPLQEAERGDVVAGAPVGRAAADLVDQVNEVLSAFRVEVVALRLVRKETA